MDFTAAWRALRDRCEEIGEDAVVVTPSGDRTFAVVGVDPAAIVVRDVETDEERTLRRDQFEVLHDRLAGDPAGLALEGLPAGVEPYVAVLSLAPPYAVEEGGALRLAPDEAGESPFLRPEWTGRSRPERVHDDAVLLADAIERADPESAPPDALVDLYVLLSDVQRGADRLRRAVGDRLLSYIGPDDRRHARFGTVRRTTRQRRRLKDEETVLAALDEADVPREWVLGVDREKLDVVLAATDLEESAVYDVDEQVYVQKTAVEEAEKQARLQGLRDRLAGLDSEAAADLRADIEEIERRIEAVLAAG